MAYTPHTPARAESSEQLRARIRGWGADLDPKDRPSVPQLQFQENLTGARWEFPERQLEKVPRERSIEHEFLTPVFGTAQPLAGLSGVLRRFSYARYSEGRLAHWMLLVLADRVDAWEHHVKSFLTLRPDNPITQTGVKAEFSHKGLASRKGRVDVRHHVLDPVIVAGPWVVGAGVAIKGVRKAVSALRG